VRRLDHAIWEVPIYYEGRTVAEGKKIRASDAVRALWTLGRLRAGRLNVHATASATVTARALD